MKQRSQAGPPTDPATSALVLEQYFPHRLSVTSRRVSGLLQKRYAEAFGLTIPEWKILTTVGRIGQLSPSVVGEWTDMDKVKVSRSAASLVGRGLLKQSQDPSDGRGRLLRLTRKGMAIYNSSVPVAQELEATLAEGLTRTEWATLNKVLVKLDSHVQKIGIGPDEAS